MSKQKQIVGFTALAIAMFMGTLDSTIINIALPDIMAYFKASLNDTSWISTIYVLGLSVFMIPASKLADQFGRKKVMLAGLVLFGGSSALCGLSGSLIFLIIMRLFQGIGGAIITPIVIPMALDLFGRDKTQKVAGAVGAVTALAAAGGPPIGGLFIKYINWQSIFFVNVPFALLSIILTVLFIEESYDKTVSKSIDWLGMFFLTMTLFLLTFALLKGRDYGWSSALIISMFAGSVICLILFLITETKVKAPLVELGLFKERTFTASSICYLITGFGIVGPLLIFNVFLQNALGYEALKAAYIVMAVSLTVIVSMPLGSVLAGKLGAKPINFFGVFCMSFGTFMLARLTANTSKFEMIADMIVFGFGLGFSCQSLVSSIKYLPEEKSGIGSGIVNAARQIGTCIGIALLVSVLNTNISTSKNDIKNNAISFVDKADIADSVKKVMIKDINENFSSDDNSTGTNNEKLKSKMEGDIKAALTSIAEAPRPSDNDTLGKLYDGASTLSSGIQKVSDGQKTLNDNLAKLSLGLENIKNGSDSLRSGIGTLDSGLSQTIDGVRMLNSTSSQKLNAFGAGIGQLNDGMQKLLLQFSPGGSNNSQTMYDAANGMAYGAQNLSAGINNYVSAVNSTYYFMIKSNPESAQLLEGYKKSLIQTQSAYKASTNDTAKQQLMPKVQALSTLVVLYTAGIDTSVTNEQQFEAKVIGLASQNGNQNIVSGGQKIVEGSSQLASASHKISMQFSNGGTFKDGVEKIAGGLSKLNQGSSSAALNNGVDKLTNALLKLKTGSDKLLTGSSNLQNGIQSAKSGSDNLLSGSAKLTEANISIKDGADKLAFGIGVIGQKTKIEDVLKKVMSDKDDKVADAFDQTFVLSAIILLAASFFGLYTDKKGTSKQ